MTRTKLVFVEGMTGSGKSTTARNIASWLTSRGAAARAFHEMDDDNPIRTRGVDAMRANHPHVGRLPGVGPDGFAADSAVYATAQWGMLAKRCLAGDETIVLESRYMQNSVQPRFLTGAHRAKVESGFAQISALVAPAAPLLIYLSQTDIGAHLEKTLATRDPAWARWLTTSFTGYAFARERGLSGQDAVRAFYEEWEQIAAELCARHPGPTLVIADAQRDWDAALAKIYAALDGTA